VVETITYQDDKTWVAAKQLAKLSGYKNDWIVTITYYNLAKGTHVRMFVLDKEGNYSRVITATDNGNVVLMKDGILTIENKEDVTGYRKFFEYVKGGAPLDKLSIPEPIKGDNYIYYNN